MIYFCYYVDHLWHINDNRLHWSYNVHQHENKKNVFFLNMQYSKRTIFIANKNDYNREKKKYRQFLIFFFILTQNERFGYAEIKMLSTIFYLKWFIEHNPFRSIFFLFVCECGYFSDLYSHIFGTRTIENVHIIQKWKMKQCL